MRRTYSVRPSKAASAVGAIAAVFMLIFGLVIMNGGMGRQQPDIPPTLREAMPDGTFKVEGRPSAPAAFQLLWVLVCGGIFVYSVWNVVSDNAPASEVVSEDVNDDSSAGGQTATLLRELEDLRSQGLITETEYATKRQDVLKRFGR